MTQFPEFYRWRLLRSRSGQILNVHRDKPGFVRSINPEYADQYLIQEDYIVGDFDQDKTSQNELFEVKSRTVLDFSESNPFGDAGSSS